jgi:hypothetical protein
MQQRRMCNPSSTFSPPKGHTSSINKNIYLVPTLKLSPIFAQTYILRLKPRPSFLDGNIPRKSRVMSLAVRELRQLGVESVGVSTYEDTMHAIAGEGVGYAETDAT